MDASAHCPHCGSLLRPVAGAAADCPACGQALPPAPGAPVPSVLSAPLIPRDEAGLVVRKPRSWSRESLLYFAVFIPLVLLATGILYLIISWVDAARK